MNSYDIWYMCRVCQIYAKGNLVANEIWWNILGDVKIDASKGGGDCKQKGNDYTIYSLSNS